MDIPERRADPSTAYQPCVPEPPLNGPTIIGSDPTRRRNLPGSADPAHYSSTIQYADRGSMRKESDRKAT